MSRPRGDGIKIVRMQMADGSVKEYRYIKPTPALERAAPATMEGLCAAYLGSIKFRGLAAGTQAQYRRIIEMIRTDWGGQPISAIKPAHVQALKDTWQDQPAKANAILAVLSLLFNFGARRGLCEANPAANPGRLPPPKRTEIWPRDEEERVLAVFRPRLRLAFALLLYTLQRPSDVLAMHRDRVTERGGRLFVAVRQAKTDALVDVPVHGNLAPLIRDRLAEPFGGQWLVSSPTGRQWTRRNFSRAWDHDLALANDSLADELHGQGWTEERIAEEIDARHRQRRDLRRTGIVRLAEAGATTPQIAAISGHAIDYCQRIIDTYLPRRTEIAIGGIEAWEAGRTAAVAYVEFRKMPGKGKT